MGRNNLKRKSNKAQDLMEPNEKRAKPMRRRKDKVYDALEAEVRAAWGRDIVERTCRTEVSQVPIELLRAAKPYHLLRLQIRNLDFVVPGAPRAAREHLNKHMPGRFESAWNRFIWGTPIPNEKIIDKVNAARKLERAAALEKDDAQNQVTVTDGPFFGRDFLIALHPEAFGDVASNVGRHKSPSYDANKDEVDEEVLQELNDAKEGTGPYNVDELEDMRDTLRMGEIETDAEEDAEKGVEEEVDQDSSSSEDSSSEDEGYPDINGIWADIAPENQKKLDDLFDKWQAAKDERKKNAGN